MPPSDHSLNSFADGWAEWMPAMSVQVCVLVAAVLVVALLARKASAQFRYLLWCLVFVKLCLPPSLAFVTGMGNWLPAPPAEPPQTALAVVAAADPAPMQPAGPPPEAMASTASAVVNAATAGSAGPAPPAAGSAPAMRNMRTNVPWTSILFGLWAAGIVGMVALLARQYGRLRRRLSGARRVSDPVILTTLHGARQLLGVRSQVRLLAADVDSPVLFGPLRPKIILPERTLEELSPAELKSVLIHELAHLRRRDLWLNWAQTILQTLYWFHPLVWFASARLRRERELAVDDMVLAHLDGQGRIYGNCLLSIVRRAAESRNCVPGCVGIVETKESLAWRLRRILDANRRLSAKLSWAAAVVLIALALVFLPQARSQDPTPAEQEPKTVEELLARMAEARKGIRSAFYKIHVQPSWTDPGIPLPSETIRTEEEFWTFEGSKFRVERGASIPDKFSETFWGRGGGRKVTVYDGQVVMHYDARLRDGRIRWLPDADRPQVHRQLQQFHYGPKLYSHQARFQSHCTLKLDGKKEEDGRLYYLLVEEIGARRMTYAIEPARGWTVARETRTMSNLQPRSIKLANGMYWGGGRGEWESEIGYCKDDSGLWRPAGWTWRYYKFVGPQHERRLDHIRKGIVQEAKLNIDVPASAFSIDYPDGAIVSVGDLFVKHVVDDTFDLEKLRSRVTECALLSAVRMYRQDAAEQLLAQGADLEVADERGRTALHVAAHRAQKGLVELLLAKGAELNPLDEKGLTPLALAIAAGQEEMAEILRERGGIE